jgi:hypothetical protein
LPQYGQAVTGGVRKFDPIHIEATTTSFTPFQHTVTATTAVVAFIRREQIFSKGQRVFKREKC